MKIKEGMYARTNEGYIAKVIKLEKDIGYKNMEYLTLDINLPTDFEYQIYKEDVIKASYFVIDLIDIGDYVNGEKVIAIDDLEGCMREYHVEGENPETDCGHWFEEIKSVVTKEQFKNMEYEVE